jgi:hypothetical protein
MTETHLAIFKGKQIRKTIHDNEWWFSVIDVVEALTDSVNPRDYWYKMKIRVQGEDGVELSTFCRQLKLKAPDGKMRGEAATTEIARNQNAQGFSENKVVANKGGRIAGEAREKLEKETKRKVITPENYLAEPESGKRLKSKMK